MIDQKILASSRMSRKSQFFFFFSIFFICRVVLYDFTLHKQWFEWSTLMVLFQCSNRNRIRVWIRMICMYWSYWGQRALIVLHQGFYDLGWGYDDLRIEIRAHRGIFLLNIRDEFWLIFCGFLFLFVCVLLVELCCVVLLDTTNFLFLIEMGFYLQ